MRIVDIATAKPYVMNRLITIICMVFFAALSGKAQYVNIPDSAFRAFLKTKYPNCFNSAGQMDTTCGAIVNETFLSITNTNATNLDGLQYFKSATDVYIINNLMLTSLPKLPASTSTLSCKSNNLTSITQFPPNIKRLTCSQNKLSSLPALPSTLTQLDISSNLFYSLPLLNDSLQYLDISSNKFTTFPQIQEHVVSVDCSNNLFSVIGKLPENLQSLTTYSNTPICFTTLPKKLKILFATYGSSVSCLPNIPDSCIYFINCFGPNIYVPPVGICNPTNNINHCRKIPTIEAFAYVDFNYNHKLDSNEFGKQQVKLSLSNNITSFTDKNGVAYVNADSLGVYTISAIAPSYFNVLPSAYTHTFTSYDTLVIDTFALQPNTLKDSIAIVATPVQWAARPGFQYAYNIQYENFGTTVVSPNISFNYDNSLLTYNSSSIAAIINNGNALSLVAGNLVPGQIGSFIAYFTVKSTAALGSSLLSVASINAGVVNAEDSVLTIVRGSYDPNDKHATPQLTTKQVNEGEYIQYTIRFQNTGTDTAKNVTITDTLSNLLNSNEIQYVASSHVNGFTVTGNYVLCTFTEIYLPDSGVNKMGSNGFITFRVKPIAPLAAGTVIPNKAYIYFDYNKAVVTNTATTVITNPVPLKLVLFNAVAQEFDKVAVSWKTSNEINTKYCVIEQSKDGINFKPAAEFAAIGTGDNSYFYTINRASVVYLRLKIVDKDGAVTYSAVIKLGIDKVNGIEILNNPVSNYLIVKVGTFSASSIKAVLINAQGIVLKTVALKTGNQLIDISNIPSGVYYLQSEVGSKKIVVEK